MTGLLVAIMMIALVAIALRVGLALIRRYKARYEAYAEAADQFYVAADRLVDNPNTPDDVLEFVGFMNDSVNFPHAALFFVRLIQKRKSKPKSAPKFNLRTLPQDVVPDFVIAFDGWINAMAYRGMFWGPVFKAYIDAASVEAKAKEVADISHKRVLAPA